ncbi:MAG: helix-turn-helix transcriptional regulator [Acidobacteriota bacterium]|nr:helix-turn-helix transcriptional regulator [Acidobacteriota bacterium]
MDLVGDKWTLLIVRDLAAGPRRFVELQRVLPGISTEQLRSRLNRMVADGMLTRKRYREVPPRVDYELTPRARDLMPVLAELALWGYRWAWSQPRTGERVDVGAILRLVPGLLRAERRGEVECTITDGHREGGPLTVTVTMDQRASSVSEEPSDRADARIRGDSRAWVSAFSPGGGISSLQISGDRAIAEQMLSGLARADLQASAGIDRAVA